MNTLKLYSKKQHWQLALFACLLTFSGGFFNRRSPSLTCPVISRRFPSMAE